uniref:Uncharacterized protein n=1 Tax=Arundo donax TaxID=35708 RepID=A0A0A9DGR2_ARUDO
MEERKLHIYLFMLIPNLLVLGIDPQLKVPLKRYLLI